MFSTENWETLFETIYALLLMDEVHSVIVNQYNAQKSDNPKIHFTWMQAFEKGLSHIRAKT